MRRPAIVSLLTAAALVEVVVLLVGASRAVEDPPIAADKASFDAQLWVVPGTRTASFLKQHGGRVDPGAELRGREPVVIGRVSWTGKATRASHYTLLLGDRRGGAGVIELVPGWPDGSVTLGSGSSWNATTKAHDWLRGDAPVHHEGQGWTDYGTFASLPTSAEGDVWFVAHVYELPERFGAALQTKADAEPVLGVALTADDSDRVWWVREVATA